MDFIPFDYATLRLIWWLLLGLLLIGFAVMDGFDLGVATLLPLVARTDIERRIVINTIGPVWEGNQVWLILGGGAIFAAFPPLYAISFSGFYPAMFVILFALILRPVGFKFRGKVENTRWKRTWDGALFIGGLIPALVFGIAIGNVLLGVPFHLDAHLRPIHTGRLLDLLAPFALLSGLIGLTLLTAHGAAMLVIKTEDPIAGRAAGYGAIAALIGVVLFAAAGLWLGHGIIGMQLQSPIDTNAPSNPLTKRVVTGIGLWMHNHRQMPLTLLAPAAGLLGGLLSALCLWRRRGMAAFLASAVALAGVILSVGLALFPFLLPSSSAPNAGLTLWDASSSRLTLWIMLLATTLFLPLILAYTRWVYRVMRGKVTEADIGQTPNAY